MGKVEDIDDYDYYSYNYRWEIIKDINILVFVTIVIAQWIFY